MIRKITLENFMSHGLTEIELADGLTVLTGPNNCGKSALVSALQLIATNGKSTHVTRHGEKLCRITIHTDDDHEIVWQRKKKVVSYQINGEDVHRNRVPESLHDYLRLDRVGIESGATRHEYDIHFGEQKSPVFLINESGSRAAAFFASSSDAARLVEMQHLHRGRVQSTRSKVKRLTIDSESNAARIAAFVPIDSIAQEVATAEYLRTSITELERRRDILAQSIRGLRSAQQRVGRCGIESRILSQLDTAATSPVDLQDRSDARNAIVMHLHSVQMTQAKCNLERQRLHALSALQAAPNPQPCDPLRSLIARMSQLTAQRQSALSIGKCCNSLVSPPDLQPELACRLAVSRLVEAVYKRDLSDRLVKTLSVLRSSPNLRETDTLRRLKRRLEAANVRRDQFTRQLALMRPLTPPSDQRDTGYLRTVIGEIRMKTRRRDAMRCYCEAFAPLHLIEPPSDPQPLRHFLEQIIKASRSVGTARQKAARQTELVESHQQLIRDFVQQHPTCETCGGKIDPATLMSTLPIPHSHAGQSP